MFTENYYLRDHNRLLQGIYKQIVEFIEIKREGKYNRSGSSRNDLIYGSVVEGFKRF